MFARTRWTVAFCLACCLAVRRDVAAEQTGTDRAIQSLQSRVKLYPQDFKSLDALGAAYIQKGRESGDATYYELAREALSKSLDVISNDPAAAPAKTHMAVVDMAEHRFEDALAWAQEALALGSGNRSPWAIAGDALTDMGRYDEAAAAYAKLRDPLDSQGGLSALSYERNSRMSYLRFIMGDPKGAVELMRSAINTATALHLPAENIAWSQYQLGEECFRSGDLDCAAKAYRAGLVVDPGSYRNLAGLADVRAAEARYDEAIGLYQKAIAVIPYPVFAASLYDVYMKAGRPEEAKKQLDLIDFIGNLNAINQRLFYRELALFYADHDMRLKESEELARKELEVRQDIYTWDILAWVLCKNGKYREAESAMRKALGRKTQDTQLFFHAGMIYDRLGDAGKAEDYLHRALSLNPQFHLVYADAARQTLRRLEAPERAESNRQKAASRSQ